MPGERCLNANARGLLVAHFAHHDDVRIGAQKRLHHRGKVHARLAVHLHLTQTLLGDFHRVFRRPYFGLGRVQVPQHRVQCGRLARAGGAAHKKQTIRLAHRRCQPLQIRVRQRQLVQWQGFTPGQNAHHHIFQTAAGRNGGHPQLDVGRAKFLELDLAVLRLALFGNIQITHDLDARHQRVAIRPRHLHIRHQRAVLAQANFRLGLARVWLDVNVRCPLVIGIQNHLVHQLDQLVVGGRAGVVRRLCLGLGVGVFKTHPGAVVLGEKPLYRVVKLVDGGNLEHQPVVRKNVVHHPCAAHMLRVQTQHHQTLFVVLDRHPFFGLDKLALEVLQQIHRSNPIAHKRLVRHTKKPRQRLPNGHRRDVVFRHQHRLQVFVSVPGQSRGVVQVGCREVRLQHQAVVFVAHHMGALALVKRNRQGLRQLN